jgi:D-glutamate cyclase
MEGLQLFVAGCMLAPNLRKLYDFANDRVSDVLTPSARVKLIEQRIQRDEGGRGIGQIIPEFQIDNSSSDNSQSHMENAAKAIIECNSAIIMTGFPCLLQNNPPTETDGPLGAICLARCLVALGKKVRIITDECNEDVLLACAATSGVFNMGKDIVNDMPLFTLESFPGMATFDTNDYRRLESIKNDVDLIIAIERAGPAADGLYKTMKGKDMTPILAPLDTLLQPDDFDDIIGHNYNETVDTAQKQQISEENTRPVSIGIGDGGNEVGMGTVYDKIINSSISLASEIACVVPTDHLIVSSVSNWGGYALAASVALLATKSLSSCLYGNSIRTAINKCLPSENLEYNICSSAVKAGAGDGISGERKVWVDGMPMESSLNVMRSVKNIALGIV